MGDGMRRKILVPTLGFVLVSVACGNHEDEVTSFSSQSALTTASDDTEAAALLAQLRTKHTKRVMLPSAVDGHLYSAGQRETDATALPNTNGVTISAKSANTKGPAAALTVTPKSGAESGGPTQG